MTAAEIEAIYEAIQAASSGAKSLAHARLWVFIETKALAGDELAITHLQRLRDELITIREGLSTQPAKLDPP